MRSFQDTLHHHGLHLVREVTSTLQINTGFRCNLACKHCHLDAGPARQEVMTRATMEEVLSFVRRNSFKLADITGGAPELVPDIAYLLDGLSLQVERVLFRSNLTLLTRGEYAALLEQLVAGKVAIAASFPSTNKKQADAQRGSGVWESSVKALKELNRLGYGKAGTGLELFLVANPAGAFLPVEQSRAEQRYKSELAAKWGIAFTNLYTFANMPLGRFRAWLERSGNLQPYMAKLAAGFNPATVAGLMCRSLISVSWDGFLYDCDFNLAAGLYHSGRRLHLSEVDTIGKGIPIISADHCYGCTAGAGFT
ncbi:arsenosugar biosynthesis radical SAM (seleno)protein ArsS [Desulfogranum mediterraneum]|uniref:arsenosugar biosynthesis radical SAM (seleno)protein ArsS n=1 Tax=Desulfogranum mediterraneum TaxID=160661 RepID=UPI000428E66E|nr:arsenosugar biosynthesis radical SAM (seleno)protein ArsS [Desulfogranum mediterraneum]